MFVSKVIAFAVSCADESDCLLTGWFETKLSSKGSRNAQGRIVDLSAVFPSTFPKIPRLHPLLPAFYLSSSDHDSRQLPFCPFPSLDFFFLDAVVRRICQRRRCGGGRGSSQHVNPSRFSLDPRGSSVMYAISRSYSP